MNVIRLQRPAGKLAKHLSSHIEKALPGLPNGFHTGFNYVRTGNNFCHAVTLSFIGEAIKSLPKVAYVGFDVRLNEGKGIKIQPDVVGFNKNLEPLILADFESPNSSDARIVPKDVATYARWSKSLNAPRTVPPYFIITCLPDTEANEWEHRYMHKGYWNYPHRTKREVIRANPLRYWSKVWAKEINGDVNKGITFLNISGNVVNELKFNH